MFIKVINFFHKIYKQGFSELKMKTNVIIGLILIAIGIIAFMFIGSGGSGNTVKVLGDGAGASPITGQTALSIPSDSGETKEFTMTANDFEFTPGVIEVNEGDT